MDKTLGHDAPYIVGGRRQPVQKRARLTVLSILQAAETVFAEDGYALASTNRIADTAGVAISSLYQYFPDKQSIYLSLYAHTLAEVADVLNHSILEVIDLDLESGFRILVDRILTLYEREQLILLHLADEIPDIRRGRHYLSLSRLIYDGGRVFLQRKLTKSDGVYEEQVFFFLHTVTFASLRSYILSDDDIFDRQTFIDELVSLIVSYLKDRVYNNSGD